MGSYAPNHPVSFDNGWGSWNLCAVTLGKLVLAGVTAIGPANGPKRKKE